MEKQPDAKWQELLTGNMRGLRGARRFFSHIPGGDRCKLCNAPFGNPGAAAFRFIGRGRSSINPWICRMCIGSLEKMPGGAEVEVSLLFADVRGSTALGETRTPTEYRALINRFYGAAADAVNHWDGLVDKFVGDEVVALWIPGLSGDDHASKAIEAGLELLTATGHGPDATPWVQLGAGVHTGLAFVGTSGHGDVLDFSALGDPVNVTARLAASAEVGELLVSTDALSRTARAADEHPRRVLELRGRTAPIEVAVLGVGRPAGLST